MAYVPKEGSGSLFKNDRKTTETHPDPARPLRGFL